MAHSIVRFDERNLAVPLGYERHQRGYSRQTMVSHETSSAAMHTGHGIVQLAPGGALEQRVLAYEMSFYVLEGSLDFMLSGRTYRMEVGDYGLILVGMPHAFRSAEGARWLEMLSPQPLAKSVGGDCFFVGDFAWPAEVEKIDKGDARSQYVGHFHDGQLPPPGNLQMDGYSGDGAQGIRQKMMIDKNFGAHHMTFFMVEFAPGGGGSHHTHPFEETYWFMSGEADATLEGQHYVVQPGDLVWTSVGAKHAFFTRGEGPVRWLETQSPLPPARQAFRFDSEWKTMRERYPD